MREPAGERATALREARWALARLDSPAGRAPFSPDLTPSYGVFYRGWTNWLRGGVLSLQPRRAARPGRGCAGSPTTPPRSAAAFDASAVAVPGRLPGAGVAGRLDRGDRLAAAARRAAAAPVRRHRRALARRGTAAARPAHRAAPAPGRRRTPASPVEVARGTSQSVIHRFLVDVDPAFAREQYLRFRDRFVASPLGLGPAVREYPHGMDGPADVDSGPLPLGVSLSATVVTLGAAQVARRRPRSPAALANYGELAGLPVDTPWTKRYAFGLLPDRRRVPGLVEDRPAVGRRTTPPPPGRPRGGARAGGGCRCWSCAALAAVAGAAAAGPGVGDRRRAGRCSVARGRRCACAVGAARARGRRCRARSAAAVGLLP